MSYVLVVLVESESELKVTSIGRSPNGRESQGFNLVESGLGVKDEILNRFIKLRTQMSTTVDVIAPSYIFKHSLIHLQYHMSDSSSSQIVTVQGKVSNLVDFWVGESVRDALCIVIVIVGVNVGRC